MVYIRKSQKGVWFFLKQMIHDLRKYFPLFQITMILVWLTNLSATDAYFSVYALVAFVSGYLILTRKDMNVSFREKSLSIIISFAFSGAVILANYPVFTTLGDPAVISRSTSLLVNLIDGFLT